MSYSIYVTSLTDYNNGILHGSWIDLDGSMSVSDVHSSVEEMLSASPSAAKGSLVEEWEIHDSEGLPNDVLQGNFADMLAYIRGHEEHGEAWELYVDNFGWNSCSFEDFEERYHFVWDSEQQFVEDYVSNTGMLHAIPETVASYFDYASFTYDLFLTDFISLQGSKGFHVFYA